MWLSPRPHIVANSCFWGRHIRNLPGKAPNQIVTEAELKRRRPESVESAKWAEHYLAMESISAPSAHIELGCVVRGEKQNASAVFELS